MGDKTEALKTLRAIAGRFPPKWVEPKHFAASSWSDIFNNSGEYLRGRMDELEMMDRYPIIHKCKVYGADTEATDIFYESRGSSKPAVFYCRWCKQLWHTDGVSDDRIAEVKFQLGIEDDSEKKADKKRGMLENFLKGS